MTMMMSTGLTSSIASYSWTPQEEGLIVHIAEQAPSGPFSSPVSHSSKGLSIPSPQTFSVQSGLQASPTPLASPSSHCSPSSTTPSPQFGGMTFVVLSLSLPSVGSVVVGPVVEELAEAEPSVAEASVVPVPSVAELLPLISVSLPASLADAVALSVPDSVAVAVAVTVTDVELALAAESPSSPLQALRSASDVRSRSAGVRLWEEVPEDRLGSFVDIAKATLSPRQCSTSSNLPGPRDGSRPARGPSRAGMSSSRVVGADASQGRRLSAM